MTLVVVLVLLVVLLVINTLSNHSSRTNPYGLAASPTAVEVRP